VQLAARMVPLAVLLASADHPPPWATEHLARIEPASLDAIHGALAARGLR